MTGDPVRHAENERNAKHIRAYHGGMNSKILEVDTHHITYKGRKWHEMDTHDRRKLENLIYLADPDQVPKTIRFV